MATKKDEIISYLLTPLSWMYGCGVAVRNFLFDNHILPQEKYKIPVVSIGNITVGGTGKTPHVEYILRHLSSEYRIAVLSRGYKRKTKGYILANSKSTPNTIGDEPYQIYQKYGMSIRVAVCEDRRKGIKNIINDDPTINLIILDDAFQHRYVVPKISIVLIDYNRPISTDKLLPLGRLRESRHSLERADMVIVTKCPNGMMPIDYRLISNELNLLAYQKLYFSKFAYEPLQPVFPEDDPYSPVLTSLNNRDKVLLITGIANPRSFVRHFKDYEFKVKICHFPYHYDFSRNDLDMIKRKFDDMKGEHKIIITTEKDAVRLSNNPYFPNSLKRLIFYVPIKVQMIDAIDNHDFIEDLTHKINNESTIH
jgi:tetraacyldisaccharide 4'-kinase